MQGGKLRGTKITSHMLYQLLICATRLNPSVAKANLKFRGSEENCGYNLFTCFYALESVGCLNLP